MRRRRIAAIALSAALVAGGTGAAIAAVRGDDAKQAEQAVLDDAAKRLDVAPEKLRDALAAAHDAQIDEAVEAGRLTQRQGDAIKAARQRSGRVLGPFGARHHGRHFRRGGPGAGRGFGRRRALLDDLAKALGTTRAALFADLRSGRSLADVAKANGTSLADVRRAVKAAAKTRLDEAVEDGDLTQRQADALLARVDEKLAAIASGNALRLRRRGGAGIAPRGEMRPGALLPRDREPRLAPRGGTHG